MVWLKNATVSIQLKKQAALPNRVYDNPALGTPWSVDGYLEHLTPTEIFAAYGVTLTSPALFQFDVTDFLAGAAQLGYFQTPAFALGASDAGNPTCQDPTAGAPAIAGTYTFTMGDATHFTGVDPSGNALGVGGVMGMPFSTGGIGFTLVAGSAMCAAGDTFTLAVSPDGARLAWEIADAELVVTGSQGGSGANVGRKYHVQGRANVFDDGLSADHVALVLDQVMFGS